MQKPDLSCACAVLKDLDIDLIRLAGNMRGGGETITAFVHRTFVLGSYFLRSGKHYGRKDTPFLWHFL